MANEWREVLARRNRTSKTKRLYEDGQPTNKYSWDGIVGTSLHYEETGGEWLEVDPRIVPSSEPGWDWEMQKSHWRFLARNGGWFAAEKKGVGIGFRLEWIAYLNIDTKEYQTIRAANYGTPTVTDIQHGNTLLANPLGKLTWANLFPGVDFEIHVSPDKLHQEVHVSQAARDAMPAPPYPANKTYLVMVWAVDWGQVPGLADDDGDIDYDTDFERTARLYLKNHQGEIITALPASKAWAEADTEAQVPLRKRFVKVGGQHYLLVGAPVLALNALPQGTMVFDPDVDVQVGAGADDGHCTTDPWFYDSLNFIVWGYSTETRDPWFRFTGISGLSGVTINVAHTSHYGQGTPAGTPSVVFYAEDAAAPLAPTGHVDFYGKAKTTASAAYSATIPDNTWGNGPSLVGVIQELATSYDPSAIQILGFDATGAGNNQQWTDSHEVDNSKAAKLHIEYTAAAAGNPWYYYAQQ